MNPPIALALGSIPISNVDITRLRRRSRLQPRKPRSPQRQLPPKRKPPLKSLPPLLLLRQEARRRRFRRIWL